MTEPSPHPATSASKAPRNPAMIGYGLIVLSTLCFSINNNLAKESYDQGVSVDTMLVGRAWTLVLLLGLWFVIRRTPPRVPASVRVYVLFAAIMFATNTWSLLTAIDLMPVSLAILVFYLFPFLVGILAAVLGIEALKPVMVLGLLVAFAGLFLALDASGTLDPWGVALSLVAAVTLSANILVTGKILQAGMQPVALSFWMMVAAAIAFGVKMGFGSGPAWPAEASGWAAFAGTILFVGAAYVTFYSALTVISGPRTSLIMNLEPIFTIVMAVFLFGEAFGIRQWVGAGLVMAAIIGVTALASRR